MMRRRLCTVFLLGAFGLLAGAVCGPRSVARAGVDAANADGGGDSILDQLVDLDQVTARRAGDGIAIKADRRAQGARLQTRATYDVPLDITLVAKTDSKNLRLFYANGVIIFNWELGEHDLRFLGPRTGGAPTTFAGKGSVPRNTFVTIRWTITDRESHIYVDGEQRASTKGTYDGISGMIGVGTKGDAVVTVKSLTVAHPVPPAVKGPNAPGGTGGSAATRLGDNFFVDVPSTQPVAAATQAAPATTSSATTSPAAAAVDAMTIERPEYQSRPKAIAKSLSSITAMMVTHGEDGQATGLMSDVIATVPPESRRGSKAAAGFYRKDGDEPMRTAFDEALRAVELRYPLWEPGRIEFSFGEKFAPHGGPSAGTAFGVLMLSCLEGFDVDPKCAITGDVSVDWRVRKAGGVTVKLRGAALAKCAYAGIPPDSSAAFGDMGLLYGNESLWDLQVFTIANLQEAVALARIDRPDRLTRAMTTFAGLQQALAKNPRAALRDPGTASALRDVLALAPNHLSAKAVLALCDGTAPKTLSANATAYQLAVIYCPFAALLKDNQRVDRTALPKLVTVAARKRLAALRPIAHKDFQPLLGDVAAFIDAMDELAEHSAPIAAGERRLQESEARIVTVVGDPRFVENEVREGY